jgi:hypothetical protein
MAKRSKVAKLSRSEIEAALSKIKSQDPLDDLRQQISPASHIRPLRRDLKKRLQPLIESRGLNDVKIGEVLQQHQRDVQDALKRQDGKNEKLLAKFSKAYRHTTENRQKALKHAAGVAHLVTPILIDAPLSIYTTPSGMEVDSAIAPHSSYAKLRFTDNKDTVYNKGVSTKFFFAWQNESEYATVINANADVICHGFCEANSSIGFLSGGKAWLTLHATLHVHLAGKRLYGTGGAITSVEAESSWFFGAGDIDLNFAVGPTNVSYPELLVREGQLVLFEVLLHAVYYIDNGSVVLDFASAQDYSVMCPHLVVGLLTPPNMVTGPEMGGGTFA